MHLNGMNWGIRNVLASLAKHNYKIPRRNVATALRIISTYYYDQQRTRRQFKRSEYNVTCDGFVANRLYNHPNPIIFIHAILIFIVIYNMDANAYGFFNHVSIG